MPCSQDDCPADPRWQPALVLHPRRGGSTSKATFCRLGYCDEHRQIATVETFLSDEGFVKLAKFMRESGKAPPDRALVELDWLPIDDITKQSLAERQDHTQSAEEELAF